jgi:hypothetical protein
MRCSEWWNNRSIQKVKWIFRTPFPSKAKGNHGYKIINAVPQIDSLKRRKFRNMKFGENKACIFTSTIPNIPS